MFATDAILAAIMCSSRSVYSWDIVVQKVGKKIFLDKREDSEFGACPKFTLCVIRFLLMRVNSAQCMFILMAFLCDACRPIECE